jgi:hypothetical protein
MSTLYFWTGGPNSATIVADIYSTIKGLVIIIIAAITIIIFVKEELRG